MREMMAGEEIDAKKAPFLRAAFLLMDIHISRRSPHRKRGAAIKEESMKTSFKVRLLVVLTLVALLCGPILTSAQRTTTKPKLGRRTTTRRAVAPLVPVATNLKVRLNETLSSKDSRVGDRFTATVIDPSRFDEAKVSGHISSLQRSGKIKGRTSMNLAFDSVQLLDGRSAPMHGYVTRVYGSDAGRADNEGGVESGSRGKQTAKRAGIGATVGAIIGGIAGGGKGAVIGLLIGGAGGAGSLAVQGNKELKLESGTELLVHVTR